MKLFYDLVNWAEKISRWLLLTIAIAVVALTLWYQISSLIFRYPLDYGEAATVDMSMRMLRSMTIYPTDLSKPDYIIANYPPLFMLAQAPLIGLFGPGFWQGRLISILCTWIAAYYLARIIHHHFKDVFAAVMAAMIFIAWPYVLMWSALARIDCLALALAMAGLFYLSRLDMTWKHFGIGAALLVAAIYTRQSYMLAVPAAAFFWLLSREWRKALLLAGIVGGTTLLIFLLLNLITSGGFFFHVWTVNINAFNMEQLRYQWQTNMIDLAPFLGLLAITAVFVLSLKDTKLFFLIGAFLLGAGLSSITIGKIGSNYNYFLEFCAALSLAAGALLAYSRQHAQLKIVQALILIIFIAQSGLFLQRIFDQQIPRLQNRFASFSNLQKLETIVASTNGTVLADEYMGLILLQNKLLYIQPFAMAQAGYQDLWDETEFVKQIHAREFPVILIYGPMDSGLVASRWTNWMVTAIEENYAITETLAGTNVFRPK